MDQNSMAALRAQLEEMKTEFADRLNRIKADVTSGLEPDSKEQAGQLENQEVLDGLGNEAREELGLISAALQRMDADEYGNCTKCGSEIDARRLAARPHAALCIACAD